MIIHSPNKLALFVQHQRKQKGLSQTDVTSKIALKQHTLSDFETRPESTKLDTLFRILSALDLELQIVPKDQALQKERISGADEW